MELIKPKKSLGQNFLVDKNIAVKIAKSIDPQAEDRIIEIGPGTGSLTSHLIPTQAEIISVELDSRACEVLTKNFPAEKYPNFRLINKNFLDFDLNSIYTQEKILKVIGNIPYNISSEIFFKLFENGNIVNTAVLMIQKELAQRLISPPGNKQYGILSIALKLVGEGKILFDVAPTCFVPRPKVTSSVIKFTFNGKSLTRDYSDVMKLVRLAFNQRRKMLKNALELYIRSHQGISDQVIIPDEITKYYKLRAEQLSVSDYLEIYQCIKSLIA